VLVIWALLRVSAFLTHPEALERITLLYLPPPAQMAPEAAPVPGPSAAHRRSRIRSSDMPTGTPPTTVPPQSAPALPPIDWVAEQARVAESNGRENWRQLSQRCRDAEALHIYPPECHRYVAPEPWKPEEKRFGLAGPLPYVRVGQCVVGLGFWGCAVGKPPPDSHVLDGMRDPDRPSPIPDNGSYRPPLEAREPLH
jgi:hypothetical protein